jgi:glucose/arabinose dehydrogenase
MLFDDLPDGFAYSSFAGATDLVLNGGASLSGDMLRLSGPGSSPGSVYFDQQLDLSDNQSFATYFQFVLGGGDGSAGAGGFAFVLQNSAAGSAALGEGGAYLGLGGAEANRIGTSFAIEFDTNKDAWDFNGNHVSVVLDGESEAETDAVNPGFKMNNGSVRHVWIDYDGNIDRLTVTVGTKAERPQNVTLSKIVDLDELLDGFAWVGFTSAVDLTANNHDIVNWRFEPGDFVVDPENPAAPVITEPSGEFPVNPGDVNFNLVDYIDPDGDPQLASDYELYRVGEAAPVWTAYNVQGIIKNRVDLSDGDFINSHAGRTELFAGETYEIRARFIDDEGNAGAWSAKTFKTAKANVVLALSVTDILNDPAPVWSDADTGELVQLEAGSRLKAAQADGDALFTMLSSDSASYKLKNYGELVDRGDVELIITAGREGLTLGTTKLLFTSNRGELDVYLPALTLAAGQVIRLWVAESGSTYWATAEQDEGTFTDLAQGTLTPWRALLPGYVIEKVATDLQLPVNIVFAPTATGSDPTAVSYYVTELYGQIKAVLNDGTVTTYASGLLDFNPTGNFPGTGEMGVAGIAIDPLTGDLFITRVGSATDGSGDLHSFVDRLSSTDGGRTMATRTVLLEMTGAPQRASHQVSNLTIGPDGYLYVHVGDAFQAQTARDLTDWRGKIIRMDMAGNPVADNPFYDENDGITPTDYIYAYGFRNPFGGAWRASDGAHYMVENGESINDRLSRLMYGEDYAWTGAGGFAGDESTMTTNAIYNWVPTHAPVNITFIETATYNGSMFPAEMLDMAFVTTSGSTWATGPQQRGKAIVGFDIDADGVLQGGPFVLAEYDGAGKGTAVAIAAGPDGLYFSDLYKDLDYATPIDRGANIWRIRYVGV